MFRMGRLNHVDFPIKTTFLRLTDNVETNILDKRIIAIVTKVSYHSRNAMHSLMLNVVNDNYKANLPTSSPRNHCAFLK